jgi:hypothetical protein
MFFAKINLFSLLAGKQVNLLILNGLYPELRKTLDLQALIRHDHSAGVSRN